MTRRPCSGPPRPLPNQGPLRPCDLAMAPEFASLAIVKDALHIALLALVAQHPSLDDFPEPGEPPTLRQARRFVASADALERALHRYCCAVQDVFVPPAAADPDADIPF
jgi:hypothetical protein